ncbi:MAG: methylated-DNA--[protein]-cysteine S-methyltransferase [Thermoleophilaceae bacterium]|nr:methylated-DNA--[protein]-cysteine S-methyltransferase [Thermoleophilaceae bacterium]
MVSLEEQLTRPAEVGDAARRAAARFTDVADAEGLLDVAYASADTPIGALTVASTARGLVRVSWASEDQANVVAELAERVSPRVLESPARLDPVRRALENYFAGRLQSFDLPIDWALVRGPFTRRVLQATNRVPFGELTSYREVASAAGSPAAVRAAGNALGSNPIPIVVPCHRVVRTGGALGGYGGGIDLKVHLLGIEGHGGALTGGV